MKALNILLNHLQNLDNWNLHVDIVEICSYPMDNQHIITVHRNGRPYRFEFESQEGNVYKYSVTNFDTDYVAWYTIIEDAKHASENMHSLAYIISKESW